jgi:hypothetical protein
MRHLLIPLLLTGPVVPLAAQAPSGPIRSPTRVATIIYRGSASEDGYPIARVPVRYAFAVCFDEIVIAYSAELDAASATSGYYFRGTFHTDDVSAEIDDPPTAPFAAAIHEGSSRFLTRVSDQQAIQGGDFGCYGQTRRIGKVVDLVGAGRTPDQLRTYVSSLYLFIEESPRPFRNTAFEARIAAAIRDSTAQARRDSIAAIATADSLSRADSLARELRQDSLTRAIAVDSALARGDTAGAQRLAAQDSVPGPRRASAERGGPRPLPPETPEQRAVRLSLYRAGTEAMLEADAAYRSGDKARAAELYGRVATGKVPALFLPEQMSLARQRHQQLAGVVMADAAATGLASIAVAEGMGAGLLIGDGYFNESWFAGATIGTARGTRLMYFDIGVGSGLVSDLMVASDTTGVEADTTDRAQFMFRLGSTLPKARLALGRSGWVAPHFSYTMLITDEHRLDLLTTGLVFWTPGSTFFRLDAMIVSGSPAFGLALGL